jgi:Fe-S cluster assembly protein SufD
MNEPLEFYKDQAKTLLSNVPWVAEWQTKALNEFSRVGFPVRKDEEWKYTALNSFLEHHFIGKTGEKAKVDPSSPLKSSITITNGLISIPDLPLPKGVIILPLVQAFIEHADLIQQYWDRDKHHIHGFHALNTAFLHTGLFIYIPKGVHLEKPLHISHYQDKNQGAHNLRHLIIAEANSELALIEDYYGVADTVYFTNTVTDIALQATAKITHIKLQRESKAAFHIGLINVKQDKASQFDSHSISLGGKLVRSDLDIHFAGEQAQCLMNGIYVPTEGQHVDHHTTVHHAVAHCSSRQDYKGILTGRSRAVFNGKVIVAEDAQHTDAKQQNKNLLLSTGAEVDTKPQLEIFADEVTCSHGATVGQLDEDALFYLATRGIAREEASAYLVHAFAADNLQYLPYTYLTEWISGLIDKQLGL